MMTVRAVASIPSVTCSPLEPDPNPLGPGIPVINLNIFFYSNVIDFERNVFLCMFNLT